MIQDLVHEEEAGPSEEDAVEAEERIREDIVLENLLESRREVFVNLPMREPEVEDLEIGEERTILIASLVSLISCTVLIFISALIYTNIKSRKKAVTPRRDGGVASLEASKFQDLKTNHSNIECSHYEYDSVSSNSSTVSSLYTTIPNISTVGSIYTTLPNGDRAIVIPLNANQTYIQQMLSNPKLEQRTNQTMVSSSNQTTMLPSSQIIVPHPTFNQENIYIDIDQSSGQQYRY